MACLDNFIGVRGACSDTDSLSGLYINDLPGVSRAMLESLTNGENQTFEEVWDKITKRAKNNFTQDILRAMPRDMRANQMIETGYYGQSPAETTDQELAAAANYRGVYVHVYGSEHLAVIIPAVTIYSTGAASTTIKIFDAFGGEELHTVAVSLVAGWNRIELNEFFSMRGDRLHLFVCYDGTTVTSTKTEETGNNQLPTIKGASIAVGSLPQEQTLDYPDNTGGLILHYYLGCRIDHFICKNKDRLANALLYRHGMELLAEILFNDDFFNSYTSVDSEMIKERMGMYEGQYRGELEQQMRHIVPSYDAICFTCQSSIQYQSNLPG